MDLPVVEVRRMIAAVWLMLSGLLYSLQLTTGLFSKPLTPEEEQHYLGYLPRGIWKLDRLA